MRARTRTALTVALGVVLGAGAVGCAGALFVGVAGLGGSAWWVQRGWEDTLRLTLSTQTGGEVSFEDLSIGLGTVTVEGIEVRRTPGEERLLRIDAVVLHGDPRAFSTSRWHVARVDVRGVHGALRLGPEGWELPEQTMALLARGGTSEVSWPELSIGELHLAEVDLAATSADGTLTVAASTAEVRGIEASMAPGLVLRIAEGRAEGIDVAADQPVAHVDTVVFGADQVVRVTGASVHTAVGRAGVLRLPPVVVDYTPRWMGGRVEIDPGAPWLGISFAGLPWQPLRAEATEVTVDLTDGALVNPAVQWQVVVTTASAGPSTDDRLPLAADLRVADGSVHVDGGLASDGRLSFALDLDDAAAVRFVPYVRETLDHHGLTLEAGVVSADLRTSLRATRLEVDGTVTARELRFAAAQGRSGTRATAANAAVKVLGNERTYTLPVHLKGDLEDPEFSPVRAVVRGMEDQIFGAVGGSVRAAASDGVSVVRDGAKTVGDGAKQVGGAVSDTFKRLKKQTFGD